MENGETDAHGEKERTRGGALNTDTACVSCASAAGRRHQQMDVARRTWEAEWIFDSQQKREEREVVQERRHCVEAGVDHDDGEAGLRRVSYLVTRLRTDERGMIGAHSGKESIVREHCGIEEGEEGEEDCAEQELVEIVVPRVDTVPKNVVPFTCIAIRGLASVEVLLT